MSPKPADFFSELIETPTPSFQAGWLAAHPPAGVCIKLPTELITSALEFVILLFELIKPIVHTALSSVIMVAV
jgi:hypothetical protein